MPRETPMHAEMVTFCRYHLGKHCFAAFSGGDWPAWTAFVYLLQSYVMGGGEHATAAMKATVRAAQANNELVMAVFVQTIAGVLDWSIVAKLWPVLADGIVLGGRGAIDRDARLLTAVQRTETYDKSTNKMIERICRFGLAKAAANAQGATP